MGEWRDEELHQPYAPAERDPIPPVRALPLTPYSCELCGQDTDTPGLCVPCHGEVAKQYDEWVRW